MQGSGESGCGRRLSVEPGGVRSAWGQAARSVARRALVANLVRGLGSLGEGSRLVWLDIIGVSAGDVAPLELGALRWSWPDVRAWLAPLGRPAPVRLEPGSAADSAAPAAR